MTDLAMVPEPRADGALDAAAAHGRRQGSRMRAALTGLALVILALAQLEIGLRLRAGYEDLRLDRSLTRLERRKPPPPGQKVTLADMIQLSPDPRIIYELMPDLDVHLLRPVHTNGAGFRGPEVTLAKPPNAVRLLGLGDSIMFGFGVGDHDTFMAALAGKLKQRHPELEWESINTAVPGYNTVMEVETLEKKGLAYDPDIVLINFVGGDDALPNFIRKRSRPLALDSSFLQGFVHDLRRGRIERDDFALANAPRADVGFVGDPERVPPEYRGMVGWDAWMAAMTRLRDLSDEHGFRVVVVGHPAVYPQVREVGRALGFPVVDSLRLMRRYMRVNSIDSDRDPRLIISPRDSHPTALLHGIIADAIVDGLEQSGILSETLQSHDPTLGPLERRRIDFWRRLRGALDRLRPSFVRFGARPEVETRATADGGAVNLALAIDPSSGEAQVDLVIPRGRSFASLAGNEPCSAVQNDIERATSARVTIRPLNAERSNLVGVARPFDFGDDASWAATQDWMAHAALEIAYVAQRVIKCDPVR